MDVTEALPQKRITKNNKKNQKNAMIYDILSVDFIAAIAIQLNCLLSPDLPQK
jgi:hypothetical protein